MNIGPFALCDHIRILVEENKELADNIFYSMYNDAECTGEGVSVAYGNVNGKLFFGTLNGNDPHITE